MPKKPRALKNKTIKDVINLIESNLIEVIKLYVPICTNIKIKKYIFHSSLLIRCLICFNDFRINSLNKNF